MKKEFGKLSSQQIKRLLALVEKGLDEKLDLEQSINEDPNKVSNFIKDKAHWSIYYELPYPHFLGLFFIALGFSDKIKEFASLEDPQEAVISWGESEPMLSPEPDDQSDEEKIIIFGLMMAMTRNFSAIQQFHIPINDLIAKAKEDDEALFDAITVDRHVLNTPTATTRIARAEATNDGQFFDLLTKAINKTRPRRPKEDFDILRYMLSALDEATGLSNLSYEQIHSLMVEDLQLYPDDVKDSFSGLKKLIQRRQKDIGT